MATTALYTAATGMEAMETKIDVIANNIANADTPGFKSSRANFQDLLYQVRSQPGVQTSNDTSTPLGTQVGLGVLLSNTQILFKQGSVIPGTNLDMAIQGDGFFQLQMPDGGIGYTRAGNFVRNAEGQLVLGNTFGYPLQPAITIPTDIPAGAISIGADGTISAISTSGPPQELGQVQLARFANPSGLLQFGGNVYLESAASGVPLIDNPGNEGLGLIIGGNLEASTTEAVTELVELIQAQRVFQMNSQVIQAADETLRTVAALRR